MYANFVNKKSDMETISHIALWPQGTAVVGTATKIILI